MPDIEIRCDKCAQTFVLTEARQAYFIETGYSQPTRCENCEAQRQKEKAQEKASRRPTKRKRF